MLAVAKRFGSPSAACGEASADIAIVKAILKAGSPHELMEESRIETIPCPDGIDRLDGERSRVKTVSAPPGECALRTAFDHNNGNELGENLKRTLDVARACEFASFSLVRQKDIDAFQHGLNIICPKIFRVVVGIE